MFSAPCLYEEPENAFSTASLSPRAEGLLTTTAGIEKNDF